MLLTTVEDDWSPGDPIEFQEDAIPGREKAFPKIWEYKWNEDDAKVHGPFTLEQMKQWAKTGYFKQKFWAREVTASTPLDSHTGFECIQDIQSLTK